MACCTCSARADPSLLAGLVGAHLVDELCVTTSPYVVGGPAGRIVHGATVPRTAAVDLDGLCEEDGFLFARWQRPDPWATPPLLSGTLSGAGARRATAMPQRTSGTWRGSRA